MRVVKTFTDYNKKKGNVGSFVRILNDTLYLKSGEECEVIQIISHGGNGTYLKVKDKSPFSDIKASNVEII